MFNKATKAPISAKDRTKSVANARKMARRRQAFKSFAAKHPPKV